MNKKLTSILVTYMRAAAKSKSSAAGLTPPVTSEELFDDAIDELCNELESFTWQDFQEQSAMWKKG
jgi:hypothetical protein